MLQKIIKASLARQVLSANSTANQACKAIGAALWHNFSAQEGADGQEIPKQVVKDFIIVKLVGGIGGKVVKNCDDGPVDLDQHPRPLAELRHHSKETVETLQAICLANSSYED